MAVKVPTVSTEDCRKAYSTITERMFCAGNPEGGKDSCQVGNIYLHLFVFCSG